MCVPVNVHFLVCVCLCVCSCACTCVKIWRVCYTFLAAHSWSIKTAKRKNNLFPNGKLLKLFTAELLVNKRAWLLIFERYTDARAHTHRVVELVFLFCWHQRDREERIKQPSLPPSIPRSFSSSPPHSNASVSWTARTGGERERGRERTTERVREKERHGGTMSNTFFWYSWGSLWLILPLCPLKWSLHLKVALVFMQCSALTHLFPFYSVPCSCLSAFLHLPLSSFLGETGGCRNMVLLSFWC